MKILKKILITYKEQLRKAITKRDGGQVKFYPYEKGGGRAEKVLAMLKGGGEGYQKFWGSFYQVV